MKIGEIERTKRIELPARETPAVEPERKPFRRHEPAPATPEKVPEKVPAGPAPEREGE